MPMAFIRWDHFIKLVFGNADIEKAKEYYKKGAEQSVSECIEALKTLSSGENNIF